MDARDTTAATPRRLTTCGFCERNDCDYDAFGPSPVDSLGRGRPVCADCLIDLGGKRQPARVAAPTAAQTPAAQTCAACGMPPTSSMCVMSDDGEGPHDLADAPPATISADDAAFLARYAVHAEQGASER